LYHSSSVGMNHVALLRREMAIRPDWLVAPLSSYAPLSVVLLSCAPLGCPLCNQLAKRAASPQET